MNLEFFILFGFFIIIVVPARIIASFGFDPEKTNVIIYILIWISIYFLFKFSFKVLKLVHKKYFPHPNNHGY